MKKFQNSIIVIEGIGKAGITRWKLRRQSERRERRVNELDYKRIKDRSFLLSLIPLELAAFFADSWPRGNTFVGKIRPAFRPLSKDRMINHSAGVPYSPAGTRAYVTVGGNQSTSKIAVKAQRVINLLGLCRFTLLLLEDFPVSHAFNWVLQIIYHLGECRWKLVYSLKSRDLL